MTKGDQTDLVLAPRLVRGESFHVRNLLSAFGDIKETRLSAALGYLIHLNNRLPELLFGIHGSLQTVYLEPRSDSRGDRYDIVLDLGRWLHVIEVKLREHSHPQVKRYSRSNRHLHLIGSRLGTSLSVERDRQRFLDWDSVARLLEKSKSKGRNADQFYNRLVDEFVGHLAENNMIQGERGDVYIRDMSGRSVDIYFGHNIYQFQPKFFESARHARYFAPYLTRSNRKGQRQTVYSILGIGISFMSKISRAFQAEERAIPAMLKTHGYSRAAVREICDAFRWRKSARRKRAVFLLGEPMRLFSNPITKRDLWDVPGGAMPPVAIDFGDLVAAANGKKPLSKKSRRRRPSIS
jgi:hypothetical protein